MFRLYSSKNNKFLQRLSPFRDFKKYFDPNWSNIYVAAMFYRLIIYLVMIIFSDSITSHGVTLSLNIAWMLFLIYKRPYKKGYKLLPVINSVIMVIISSFYIYLRNFADSFEVQFTTYAPIGLIVILGLTSIFNTIYAIIYFRQ